MEELKTRLRYLTPCLEEEGKEQKEEQGRQKEGQEMKEEAVAEPS